MRYCKKCVLPDTRPNVFINSSGLCNSKCSSNPKKINLSKREREFEKLVRNVKKKKKNYDCIIPVSGGKDSTWQVMTALKYKLKPLCLTWKSPQRNSIGLSNLENLIRRRSYRLFYKSKN